MRVLHLALGALLSHWRRHPLQFFSIVTGLWLATALWTGVQALNSQARADYARASAIIAAPADAQLVPVAGQTITHATYLELRRLGWKVSPVLEGRVRFAGNSVLSVHVLGIEPLTLPAGTLVAGQAFADFDLAAFTGRPGQAWIAPDTIQRLGAHAGQQLRTADGQILPPLRVQEQLAPGVVVVDIGHAQALLQSPGAITRFLVDDLGAKAVESLPAHLASVLQLETSSDEDDLQRLTDSFHLNLTALGLLAFMVGLFIVHASIGLAFEQRRGLLRTLRACGVSLRALVGALAVELGLLAIVGGAIGVLTGYFLAVLLLPDVAASLRSLYGAEVAGTLSLSPLWWAAGVSISLLGALLAGVNTLVRAVRLPVLAMAQPQAWRDAQSIWLKRQAWAALGLVIVALLAWQLGSNLISAFTMVAALLLAAALLLPVVLDAILAALMRVLKGPMREWFVADGRQQLPALSLALMALLLALGASVGVGSMTEGFRHTFTGWLNQRLAADLYLTPHDTRQGQQMLSWLQQQPGIAAIEPQWRSDVTLPVGPVQLIAVGRQSQLSQHWPLLEAAPNAWQQVSTSGAVMVSEQLARRLGVGLGATVHMPVPYQSRLQVVGIYADYGNPRGHMLVSADWLRNNFADARLTGLALYMPEDAMAELQQRLHEQFGLDSTRMVEQAAVRQWSVEVFERTFTATGALNILTLAVAAVALFISLLTLGASRLGQLAPLWALGVERNHLAWLSLAQTLMLSGLTVLMAMPLGILLAWCLVDVVNVYAFGWRLPLYVFPSQLALLAGLGLLASLLAAAVPIVKLGRSRPADLLRHFSHDV